MREVKAIEYVGPVPQASGACEPIILSVECLESKEIYDAYVKLTDKLDLGVKAYVIEAISSFLAHRLGLFTPEPCIVHIEDDFIDSVYDANIQQRLKKSERVAYGTKALPKGFGVPIKNYRLKKELLDKALDIFVFDKFIENPDRGGVAPSKPNCLTDDLDFAVIDHEKAFPYAAGLFLVGQKLGSALPWQPSSMKPYGAKHPHLFSKQLWQKRRDITTYRLAERWRTLSNKELAKMEGTLPKEWVADEGCPKLVLDHIKAVRDNMDDCVAELNRVFGK